MSDDLEKLMMGQPPTADRPLQGLTVLVVEDSRFASEAIRLLSLRSGARIRRADSLGAAHRHLRVYRPSIVIVDMGLPDGCGADLIAQLAADPLRVPVLLGMSGDATNRDQAMQAGADGFLAKPVESLAVFQQSILSVLPPAEGPVAPRALPQEVIEPDAIAFQDDLCHAAALMRDGVDGPMQDYLAQFLGGVARSAHDNPLEAAATDLAQARAAGRGTGADLARVQGLLQDRLSDRHVL
ncbi:response regulator [Aliiroseovarius sp. S2029]|uniref:response regulator transcription factor n=1 Tax=Aliiroseovarius sp. S2029 TaxID=2936988 RepID=UPI0020BF1386|nr:response regulator [Aliiroseovarius sp. S2029]MCK8483504.1 response regulator [Aliiroseovarius sp. S2029]